MVQVLWLASAAVLGVIAMVALVVWISEQAREGEISVRIGDDTFRAGPAEALAPTIAAEGPLLFSDVAGGDRDLLLQHLGDDPADGWHAFAARPLQAPRDCIVEWQADDARFVDSCDGTQYPADGAGLPPFPVRVDDDGQVEVVVVAGNEPGAGSGD
jgi:hypothetical protein